MSFLSFVQAIAPPPLAQSAAALSAAGVTRWEEVLDEFWRAGAQDAAPLTEAEALIAWTFLQPYAEVLADRTARLDGGAEVHGTPPLCPLCAGRPLVGVLRPLGDGAKRSLVCSLCATEWEYRRIVCSACGEESVDKLPVYVAEGAEELDYVRVEACDTCRHYIKTIDLTKNGRAVPVVDELAAIPQSLGGGERVYEGEREPVGAVSIRLREKARPRVARSTSANSRLKLLKPDLFHRKRGHPVRPKCAKIADLGELLR